MRKIVIATKNNFKVQEITRMLFGFEVEVKSLLDYPNVPDVIEDLPTFEGNAQKKALNAVKYTDCFSVADDSGLVVEALGGKPGIFSARYAGLNASFRDNNLKVIQEMREVPEHKRTADFVCVLVCASTKGASWVFEGRIKGSIALQERGAKGFGYDPIFIPSGYDKTFAEMDPKEKDKISHRALALKKFKFALNEIFGNESSII